MQARTAAASRIKSITNRLSNEGKPMNLYRHKKTGGVYAVLIENAVIESDQTPCVVYQGVDQSVTWVRPAAEFHDGRFEKLRPSDVEK
jgi:hypothetical protein